ncbi:MAG: YigZ family protein [Deltaproteobacteria bacterium]
MRERYKTVKSEGTAEIIEKKSKFIAHVRRIASEEEAMEFYETIKKKYWDARHNVYAYYIGGDSGIQKFSDEGEPSGTAGMPILQTIKNQGVEDVIVVVTRYFGGILLGTGGLVRAYSKSAGEGIKAAGIVEKIWSAKVHMRIDYNLLTRIQAISSNEGCCIIDTIYADLIDIYIAVPINKLEKLKKVILELTGGGLQIDEIDRDYYIE